MRLSVYFIDHKGRLKRALKDLAQAHSDLAYEKFMANFYTDRVLALDPHQHWHEFAECKDGQLKHQTECERLEQYTLPRRQARLEARIIAAQKAGVV